MNRFLHSVLVRQLPLSLLLFVLLPVQAQDHTDWSRGAVMYEVNVRQYSNAGTFRAFSRHMDRLQDLGVDILWFMPIHPIGEVNRKGTLGSYYAVQDYLGVNPEFGTLDEFKALVEDAHVRGMKVILDWVANHSAPDNPLASEHPTWYVRDANMNFVPPPGTDWTDVIQFNHAHLGLLAWMQNALTFWVQEVGVDGFRFDAASFVPNSFWVPLLAHLKSVRPDLLLLAESDGRRYHDAGFDMTFAWGLYGFGGGVLADVVAGSADADDVWNYLLADRATYPDDDYRLYFTSNHDENSWIGTVQERFGGARGTFALLAATMNDMSLIYSGQEVDNDRRLAFFENDAIVWEDHHPIEDLYQVLNEVKEDNTALWSGSAGADPVRVDLSEPRNVLAFMRTDANSKVVVIANLSPEDQTFTMEDGPWRGTYVDPRNGDIVELPFQGSHRYSGWHARVLVEASATDVVRLPDSPDPVLSVIAYPNPSPGGTVLDIGDPAQGSVTWEIVDVLGRRMDGGVTRTGSEVVRIADRSWPAGIYFYRVRMDGEWIRGAYVRR